MLLVLAAPSKHDSYYRKHCSKFVKFLIAYAKAINGRDNVVLLADEDTMPYFSSHLPSNILLTISVEIDTWIRDFSPVMPEKPIQFKYCGGINTEDAKEIQEDFNCFTKEHEIEDVKVDLYNDGGNIIDNGKGCVVTTDKFLSLNKLKEPEGISQLQDILKVDHVVILPADEELLGHIDGMCSFLNEKTLFVVDYEEDRKFKKKVNAALNKYLPDDVEVVEIQCGSSSKQAKGGFKSAYGLYVNCVPTEKFIYVPLFGDKLDQAAMELFQQYANGKECVFVDASNVCHLGGSLRCLSWQVVGQNAANLIHAASVGPPF